MSNLLKKPPSRLSLYNLLVCTETFEEEDIGTYLPNGISNLEVWQRGQAAALKVRENDTEAEWEAVLVTEETFPVKYEIENDILLETETHYMNKENVGTSITRNSIPPLPITERAVPSHQSYRKHRIGRKTGRKKCRNVADNDDMAREVANIVQKGVQWNILNNRSQPKLYSLLRAWVLGTTQNQEHIYCRPKRKTLVDYVPLPPPKCRDFGDEILLLHGLNENPLAAVDVPPIDILDWLKIRHILKESSPYSKYFLSQMHMERIQLKQLRQRNQRKRLEQTRRNLRGKGIQTV